MRAHCWLFLALSSVSFAEELPIESGLEAYWPLDGSLIDVIGGNHGRARNLDEASFQESPLDSAIHLRGERDHFEVFGEDTAFGLLPHAYSFWIRVEGVTGHVLYVNWTEPEIEFRAPGYLLGTGHIVPETLSLPPATHGGWHHVVVTSPWIAGQDEAGPTAMYVDGKLVEVTRAVQGRSYQVPLGGFSRRLFFGGDPRRVATFRGSLDDIAFWRRNLRVDEIVSLYESGRAGLSLRDLLADADSDQLPDVWENKRGLDATIANAEDDSDEDGLDHAAEFLIGTHPMLKDTDGDGLEDGEELALEDGPSNPVWADTDEDGLDDSVEPEFMALRNKSDTDGDGFRDGDEISANSDLNDPNSKPDLGVALVAYWTFDQGLEESIQGIEGEVLPQGIQIDLKEGMLDKGLHLDKTSYVDLFADPEDFGFTGQSFSFACWARLDQPGTGLGLRTLLSSFGGREWRLDAVWDSPDQTGWTFFVPRRDQRPWREKVSLWEVRDERWHHIAGVYRSPKGGGYGLGKVDFYPIIYVDGVPLDTGLRNGFSGRGTQPAPLGVGLRLGGVAHPSGINRWEGMIDDLAIWNRAITASEVRTIYRGAVLENKSIGDLRSPDGDFDGLPDVWEVRHGFDPETANDKDDVDGDLLTNLQEYRKGLDPNKADTDDDGFADNVETQTGIWVSATDTGTSPRLADSDGDGLIDGSETGSDPNRRDTDADGLTDDVELVYGSDPELAGSVPDLAAGLQAYWPLDSHPNDATGTYQVQEMGMEPLSYVPGRHGNAASFNGIDQAIRVLGNEADFDNETSSVAVSAWFHIDQFPSNCAPSHQEIANDPRCTFLFGLLSRGLGLNAFNLSIGDRCNLNFHTASKATREGVSLREWHHVVGVIDQVQGLASSYVDGELYQSAGVSLIPTDLPLLLGAVPGEERNTGFLLGLLDDVAIWNRPLTADEVSKIWKAGSTVETLLNQSEVSPSDRDGDGVSDASEAIAGTDPDKSNDYLHITQVVREERGLRVGWTSIPGRHYDIDFSPSLEFPQWKRVSTVSVPAQSKVSSFLDTENGGQQQGYFRVRVHPL